jgi:ABC-2 type transport system permease protein
MRAFLALLRREFLEHRLAYVIAPMVLLGLLVLAAIYFWLSTPGADIDAQFPIQSASKIYDLGYGLAIQAWWYYALASLFFYYADAFHGDTRNNAMLFWKSMPQSDLKISLAKLITGMSVFPGAIFLAAIVTGLVLILPASVAGSLFGLGTTLDMGAIGASFLNITAIGAVYFVLGLLWYAPFFAWVGTLSTILGRWSIPLAFLIPAIAVIFELLVLRPDGAPNGSYLLAFLSYRTDYSFGALDLETVFLVSNPISAASVIGDMIANYDWITVGGGIVAAAALMLVSAEYRRRYLLT